VNTSECNDSSVESQQLDVHNKAWTHTAQWTTHDDHVAQTTVHITDQWKTKMNWNWNNFALVQLFDPCMSCRTLRTCVHFLLNVTHILGKNRSS